VTGSLEVEGQDRVQRVNAVLEEESLDALVCALPSNVLMLSGYWPVVAASIAVATKDGIALLVPEDEMDLAGHSWAREIWTYRPGSLSRQLDTATAMSAALKEMARKLSLGSARIGHEVASTYEGSSYSATFRFQDRLPEMLAEVFEGRGVTTVGSAVQRLRFTLTPYEVDRVRCGSSLLAGAFVEARGAIQAGAREPDISTMCAATFERAGLANHGVQRAGAFSWCMSGPNSAKAGGAFARTTNREIAAGDLVLLHCNPYIDGYFGDVTRTYSLGEPTSRVREMFEAILLSRDSALSSLGPGIRAADVDRAARKVLEQRGFGDNFTHGVGHSLGFSVISAEYPPRLNPTSPDVLEVGCTVNIEPAIYVEGFGGIRHCDAVTITATGYELLTPFDSEMNRLVVD